jgi:hypothetical protein
MIGGLAVREAIKADVAVRAVYGCRAWPVLEIKRYDSVPDLSSHGFCRRDGVLVLYGRDIL